MFSKMWIKKSINDCSQEIERLRNALQKADAVVVGGGAGLSASAGFTYSGQRFEQYFSDFIQKYGFKDMYSGGFSTFEEHWAYWSRYIYINRLDGIAQRNDMKIFYSQERTKKFYSWSWESGIIPPSLSNIHFGI